jgi:basic membrane protein A
MRGHWIGAVAAALLLAGCGGSSSSGGAESTTTAATTQAAKHFKVGLVTDTGGLNDRGFNHLAFLGLQKAQSELGVKTRVIEAKSTGEYVPNLTALARQGYDLIIGVGFTEIQAMGSVAGSAPDSHFAIVDVSYKDLTGKPANVEGLLFHEEQVGYLAGYAAALAAKAAGGNVVSSVGGQKQPPVDLFIAGYQAGAKKAVPGITTLNAYSQDFVDQAKCKEIALDQISKGSKVVFQVAGGCGLGALDAAKEKGVQGIGVDADQAYLGSQILTSATKKVDVAVYDTIEAVQKDQFTGGKDTVFDLKTDGVGVGKISAAGTKYQAQVDKVAKDIAAGTVTVPDALDK